MNVSFKDMKAPVIKSVCLFHDNDVRCQPKINRRQRCRKINFLFPSQQYSTYYVISKIVIIVPLVDSCTVEGEIVELQLYCVSQKRGKLKKDYSKRIKTKSEGKRKYKQKYKNQCLTKNHFKQNPLLTYLIATQFLFLD